MWINEKRFQNLAGDFVKLRDKLTELPGEVRNLRSQVTDLADIFIKDRSSNEQKINNLVEVIRAIAKPSDLKKVIAVGDDDTEITVGDVLDADGLVPECESEVAEDTEAEEMSWRTEEGETEEGSNEEEETQIVGFSNSTSDRYY